MAEKQEIQKVSIDIKGPKDRREVAAILVMNGYKVWTEDSKHPKFAGECRLCFEVDPNRG